MVRYRAITSHAASYPNPLQARAGASLTCERSDSEWPGWIWCASARGRSGWVPESWLRIEAGTCTLLRDYDAVELSVSAGEILTGSVVAEGWLWATDQHGQSGWVPLDCLEELE